MAWTHGNILSNYFVYLGNKDISCIFKTATKPLFCFLQLAFTSYIHFFGSNNMLSIIRARI